MAVSIDNIPLFRFLTADQIQLVLKNLIHIDKQKGQPIVVKGEKVLGVFIVASGTVGVYGGATKKSIATLEEGRCFGEMALLEGMTASATVRAEQENTHLWLLRSDFMQLQSTEDKSFAVNLFRGMAVDLSSKLCSITALICEQQTEISDFRLEIQPNDLMGSLISDLEELSTKLSEQLQKQPQGQNELLVLAPRLARNIVSLKKLSDFLTSLTGTFG